MIHTINGRWHILWLSLAVALCMGCFTLAGCFNSESNEGILSGESSIASDEQSMTALRDEFVDEFRKAHNSMASAEKLQPKAASYYRAGSYDMAVASMTERCCGSYWTASTRGRLESWTTVWKWIPRKLCNRIWRD